MNYIPNLISVVVVTYNHEPFIKEAIQSILDQEINDIEIIIGDDCSSDNTTNLIEKFTKKSKKIKLIKRESNIGATKNLYDCLMRCKGEFIAILEGDDFWTDSKKLSIQRKFLSKNKNYIACTHRYSTVNNRSKLLEFEYSGIGKPKLGEYTINEFLNYTYYGHLGTLFFRNIFCDNNGFDILFKAHPIISDITLNLILSLIGNIYVLDLNMAAHRIVINKNSSNYKSQIHKKNKIKDRILYFEKLKEFAKNEFNYILNLKNRNPHYLSMSLIFYLRYPSIENFLTLKFVYDLEDKKLNYIFSTIKLVFIDTFNILKRKFAKKS